MMLKKLKLGIFAAALLAVPFAASAADLPSPSYKAPSYVAPSFSWSGLYVGVNAGYGFGKADWQNPAVSMDPKGFVGGATIGYNLQTGSWVWGIEGDIDYSAMKDSSACGAATCETKNTWFGTARGRIGYGGWGSFMPYITGGAAFGNVKATNNNVGGGVTSETRFGWTLGAGLEYALWSAWSVKGEYLYFDLGKFDCPTCGAAPNEVSFKGSLIRAGLNYRW